MSTIKVDNIEAKTGAGDITIASALSGAATKFKISGGSANYILSTDGSAGLSWIANDQGDLTGVTAGNGITVANPTGPVPTVTVGQGTGVTVNANDVAVTDYANLANRTSDAAWTGSQRATLVTDNDGSFDLDLGQNFFCTPAGSVALTFTNHVSGQSGYILFDNAAAGTITLAATTKGDANLATTLSTAGTYLVSYLDNGTNAYLTTSAVFA